jgi:hypothetical protein
MEKINKEVSYKALNSEYILVQILKEIKIKTKILFDIPFYDKSYSVNWYEAYIPLIYNKEEYLLTWKNCD